MNVVLRAGRAQQGRFAPGLSLSDRQRLGLELPKGFFPPASRVWAENNSKRWWFSPPKVHVPGETAILPRQKPYYLVTQNHLQHIVSTGVVTKDHPLLLGMWPASPRSSWTWVQEENTGGAVIAVTTLKNRICHTPKARIYPIIAASRSLPQQLQGIYEIIIPILQMRNQDFNG